MIPASGTQNEAWIVQGKGSPVRCIALPNNHDFFIQSPYSAMVMGNLSAWSSLAMALA